MDVALWIITMVDTGALNTLSSLANLSKLDDSRDMNYFCLKHIKNSDLHLYRALYTVIPFFPMWKLCMLLVIWHNRQTGASDAEMSIHLQYILYMSRGLFVIVYTFFIKQGCLPKKVMRVETYMLHKGSWRVFNIF